MSRAGVAAGSSLARGIAGLLLAVVAAIPAPAALAEDPRLQLEDVFELEYASSPEISPDGTRVVYVRNFMDRMKDRQRSSLWLVGADGADHRPLTTGEADDGSPRWSPDGGRLAYTSSRQGSTQLWVRWMDTGQTARLSQLERPPRGLAWSPDGTRLAFVAFVSEPASPLVELPAPPKGAEWAEPPKVIRNLTYRADGGGYLENGHTQVFVIPAEGGTARQLTEGPFDHGGPLSWADDRHLVLVANRHDNWEYDPADTEVMVLDTETAELRALTSRHGPDGGAVASPDGRWVAYTGYDERYQGYQRTLLSVVPRAGGEARVLTAALDRSVGSSTWSSDSRHVYFQYDDLGETKVGRVGLDGVIETVTTGLGGLSLGRPYTGASFSLARDGSIAFTATRPDRPADVAVLPPGGGEARRVTALNEDLLGARRLGSVEEIWVESSFDRRRIHGWVVKPPDFDPARKHPLVLEIHGGPFAAYGPHFAAEVQLFAAAGYVVLYMNPRGSTSYGEELGNLIHHAYPSQDYDDLMSGVDAVIAQGSVDPERLYVTGGSGGGVLTAWIVGKTERFRAAVVAKPVINWASFVLTTDFADTAAKYWFPALPWEDYQHYWQRSPLSLVGNVTTPTMVLTGEEDYRTPMAESEQYYQALRLRGIDTALVRIPGASHSITARPSQFQAKVAYILAWFARFGGG
ncbi:MAG TPA: S9 family peptidase [Thermoanaerobaculia bacterium]|nr:S9 family peptidase [Thermoanaerobaculia bacterium]